MANKTLDSMMTELKQISQAVENPDISIDECVELYEKGMKLSAQIDEKIKAYELKVNMLSAEDK